LQRHTGILGAGALADAGCRLRPEQAGENAVMMQLDDIAKDLKTRKDNLTKLKKEIASDQAKMAILASITDLLGKIDPLVTEAARLENVKKSMKKFSTDVDTLNGKRKQQINAFNALKKSADAAKKDDTKTKDFSNISDDATAYVALNDFEKT
jgi:vacuolar-type H+-ATPase subunit I/STV1